eukprot:4850500-Pleurochrysis_carterae.AAC.2
MPEQRCASSSWRTSAALQRVSLASCANAASVGASTVTPVEQSCGSSFRSPQKPSASHRPRSPASRAMCRKSAAARSFGRCSATCGRPPRAAAASSLSSCIAAETLSSCALSACSASVGKGGCD